MINEKIYKKNNKIIVEIPFFSERFNPYMIKPDGEPEYVGKYPTLTGLIVKHRKNGNYYDEIGFALTIDMDYKGKQDQVGGFVIMWYDSEEEFRKKCNELGLGIYELNL